MKEVIVFDLGLPIGVTKEAHYEELLNLILKEAVKDNISTIEVGAVALAVLSVVLPGLDLKENPIIYQKDSYSIKVLFNPKCYRKILFDGELAFELCRSEFTINEII